MDYKEEYEAMVQRARELHEAGDFLTKKQMEIVCPELTESEDERIRKELKEAFEAYDIESKWNGIPIRSIFAWLEKQKEQKPAEWDELQADFRNINEAFEDGKKEVVDNPERYGLCRPAEWSEEDEKMINTLVSYVEDPSCWNLKCPREKLVAFIESLPKRFSPQAKQEWDEEDEDMLNSCISSIEEAKENRYAYKENDGDTSYDREINWLKSLHPQYHGDVTMTEAYKMGLEAGKASSWKPSEEQMEALKSAVKLYKDTHFEMYHKRIVSLYEQLKKLM